MSHTDRGTSVEFLVGGPWGVAVGRTGENGDLPGCESGASGVENTLATSQDPLDVRRLGERIRGTEKEKYERDGRKAACGPRPRKVARFA